MLPAARGPEVGPSPANAAAGRRPGRGRSRSPGLLRVKARGTCASPATQNWCGGDASLGATVSTASTTTEVDRKHGREPPWASALLSGAILCVAIDPQALQHAVPLPCHGCLHVARVFAAHRCVRLTTTHPVRRQGRRSPTNLLCGLCLCACLGDDGAVSLCLCPRNIEVSREG